MKAKGSRKVHEWEDQLRLMRAYLDSCDAVAYIDLGLLGNPIDFIRDQLDSLEQLHRKRCLAKRRAKGEASGQNPPWSRPPSHLHNTPFIIQLTHNNSAVIMAGYAS